LNQIFKSLHAESADIDLAFAVDDLLCMRLGVVTYAARSLSTTSRKVSDVPDFTYSLGTCRRR
jgi:hypothetical protein